MSTDNPSDDDARVFAKAMSKMRTNPNFKRQRFNSYDQRPKPKLGISTNKYISTDFADPAALDQTNQDNVLFVRAGLQHKVVKRLQRGNYTVQSVLDLHEVRTPQVERLLEEFLAEAIHQKFSCILIIHGKGYHSENNVSVLKPYTIDWLKQTAEIKAFCSAHPKDGGTGAVYVLL